MMINKPLSFAAFVMTYERENILLETIKCILNQSCPPEKVLIVDNSTTQNTFAAIKTFNHPKVHYHAMGYNSGPAGAAHYGLKTLAEEGFEWIYWGDDDDPPKQNNQFECLLKITESDEKIGCVGAVGHFFDGQKGEIIRVSDKELSTKGVLEVDNIAGNVVKIINGKMIRDHDVLPNADLFFGFEELHYDLQIKNAGYKLFVDKEMFYESRKTSGRLYYTRKTEFRAQTVTWREYYSIRNTIFIFKEFGFHKALVRLHIKKIAKTIFAFRYGFDVGFKMLRYTLLAFWHGWTNQSGLKLLPVSKKINK